MSKLSKQQQKRPSKKLVRRIPAAHPEARDEGPRLLPWLDDRKSEQSHVDYLVGLADIVLGKKKKS